MEGRMWRKGGEEGNRENQHRRREVREVKKGSVDRSDREKRGLIYNGINDDRKRR
jgi:hypothetical protein